MYPSFSDDKRYLNMLGNPGSNPLELFWDLVDGLDQKLDAKIATVEDAIKRHNDKLAPVQDKEQLDDNADGKEKEKAKDQDKAKGGAAADTSKLFKVTPETTKEEFLEIVKGDEEASKKLQPEDFDEVYQTVSSKSTSTRPQ